MKWIADNWKVIATTALILFVVALAKLAGYYHGKFIKAESLATERQQNIDDVTVSQRDVAAHDAEYTKELASAKAENNALQRKLDRDGRVLVAGTCPKQATQPASVDDGTIVELSQVAGRNLLGIRAGIKDDGAKIAALQQYIKEQYLK